jgi:hypothetical protein
LSPELVFTKLILQILYWIYEIAIHRRAFAVYVLYYPFMQTCEIYIISFLEWKWVLVCFTVWENAGVSENYKYAYQE